VFIGSPSAVFEVPDDGVVVVCGVVVVVVFVLVDAVATGTAAVCAWNPRTAAVPKTVEPMTIGARFMSCS